MSVQNVQIDCTVSPLRVISVNYGNPGLPGPPGPTAVSTDTGNAARLGSDALIFVPPGGVPGPHQATHHTGGADQIPVATPSSTGLVPVLPNVATQYLNGTGVWSTPAGGGSGDMLKSVYDINNSGIVDNSEALLGHVTPASGNATAAQVVLGTDTRLSDTRTPTAHGASHAAAGSDPVGLHAARHNLGGADPVSPDWTQIANKPATFPASSPLPLHAATHNLGGSDAVAPDWTQVANKPATMPPSAHAASHLDNGTDVIPVVTTTRTGLVPKLSGTATTFLNGTGSFSTPAGGGGGDMTKAVYDINNDGIVDQAAAVPWTGVTGKPATFAPSAHATSHESGGADAIPLDTLAAPTDITTLNASLTAHGLLPKLGGGTGNFLRADGTWASPPAGGGGGDMLKSVYDTNNDSIVDHAALSDTAPWTGITGKPATFPPDATAELIVHKGAASGYASLDAGIKVPVAQLPAATATVAGIVPTPPNNTTTFLRGDATFATPTGIVPSAHGSTHAGGGTDPVPIATTTVAGLAPAKPNAGVNATTTQVVMGDDTRLSDARTPSAHQASHVSGADQIPLPTTTVKGLCPPLDGNAAHFLSGAGTCVAPPAAAPAAHAATHEAGGSDVIPIDLLAAATDNTNLNATTTAHGLMAKANNVASNFYASDATQKQVTYAMLGGTQPAPLAHGSTHLPAGSDPIALATTAVAGLCPPPDGTTIQITGGKLVSVAPAGAISVFIEAPTVKTYVLDLDAPVPYSIIKYSALLTAGTATVSLLLNGVAITGATNIAVSTTLASGTLSQAVATGNTLSLQVTAASSAANLSMSVRTL